MNALKKSALLGLSISAIVLSGCLSGGSSSNRTEGQTPSDPGDPVVTRVHDSREFNTVIRTPPTALPGTSIYYGTYPGLQGNAIYVVEVPDGWDGDGLVMWTRGYGGEGLTLTPSMPFETWREEVIAAGYAWASSSYSANFYDVRAAIEDTNKLALNFSQYIEADYSERLSTPNQYLISGVSLGGHTAAAAVDRENRERAQFKVNYAGAAPLCQSEQNEFQWLGDYTRAAMVLSRLDDDYADFDQSEIIASLFSISMVGPVEVWTPRNDDARNLRDLARNLTGGPRPVFEQGFQFGALQRAVLGTGGSNGDINGILAGNIYGNQNITYRWTNDPEPTAEEVAFNEELSRVSADPNANPLRNDGVRWLPLVNGDFDVPVMTMHTLGDFYVPFRHQQLYRERAIENGNEDLLVQRAIRGPSHCDFSVSEYRAFVPAWLDWVNGGAKPAGDEVLDPAIVADPNYGCQFTINDPSQVVRQLLGVPTCPQ